MKRSFTTTEVRSALSRLLRATREEGRSFVIEQHGQPAAALVPVEVLLKHEQSRREALDAIRTLRGPGKKTGEDALAALADREVETVRAARYRATQRRAKLLRRSAGRGRQRS